MKIIGLTGSIGMGKSETAKMFTSEGVPVFDADAEVHKLQGAGGEALPLIDAAFPGVIVDGHLDRAKLGAVVFSDADSRKKLEAIMHPMVGKARAEFFKEAEKTQAKFVVIDVPLLFEVGGDKACDKIIVVSAPAAVQRERVLARPGMSVQKFEQILAKQTPDADKRAAADYIIETDKGFDHARARVVEIIEELKEN